MDAANMARNDWKLPNGDALKNLPHVCSASSYVDSFAGLKTSLVPIASTLAVTLASYGILQGHGFKELVKTFPAVFIMMFCSFFLFFSPMWVYGLLSCFVAMVSVATVGKYVKWLLLLQFVMFWLFIGGSEILVANGLLTSTNLVVEMATKSLTAAATSCASYYGHFNYDATNTAWYVGARNSWGYCSLEWVGFVVTMAMFNLFAFFFLMFTTALRVASGIDNKKSLAAQDSLGEFE